jgi:hypothetical protein
MPRLEYSQFFVAFYAYDEDGVCAGAYSVPWTYFTKEEHEQLLDIFDHPENHKWVCYLSRENQFIWRTGKRLGWWLDEHFPDQDAATAKLTADLVQFQVSSTVIAGPLVGSISGSCCM